MAFLDNTGLTYLWGVITGKLNTKVDKIDGKGLSTNDFTTDEKTKLNNQFNTVVLSATADGTQFASVVESINGDDSKHSYDITVNKASVVAGLEDTFAKKADYVNAMRYKGSVANEAALPTENVQTGDVYDVADTGMNVAWDGTKWDKLGQTFTIQAMTNAEIDAIVAAAAG